jgi:molybdopterin converting factor small subunit
MNVTVHFYSYFKDLTGCARTTETVPAGTTVGELHQHLMARFPKLSAMRKSTLIAVAVEYQPPSYVLKEGDEVSLFPPVQGG